MEHHRIRSTGPARIADDHGLSLLITAISLLVSALLVLLVLEATASSDPGPKPGTRAPAAAADATLAQQNLSAGLSAAALADAGGQGSLDAATLQAGGPAPAFTQGPSTGPGTVSVTPAPDGNSVTLVARSTDGTCWAVWWSPDAATWYGAQSGQSSCTAPALSVAPSAGSVSNAGFGWQQGAFPTP